MTRLYGRKGEGDCPRISVWGKAVDPGSAWIAEAKELGNFIESFAGGVVNGAANVAVLPSRPGSMPGLLAGKVKMSVASGDDEREYGSIVRFGDESLRMIHQHGMDVAFKVVDCDEGLAQAECEGFGVGDADEKGSGEPRAAGHGDGVDAVESKAGLLTRGLGNSSANHRNDVAKVLAAGELRDDAAIVGVQGDLAGDDVGEGLSAMAHDRGGGLVAGALNAQNEAGSLQSIGHLYVLTEVRRLSERRENARYGSALQIVERLRGAGHAAYFAGGCVRDMLLGLQAKDFDVATSATPDAVIALFEKTFAVGAHFGVVLVCLGRELDGNEIATEVATFRNDGVYTDGRRPDAVRFSTEAREDVVRRDFTINGMLLDPVQLEDTDDVAGAVLDFVGGREDLRAGVVRAIGDARVRFAEDKLRMLRAVRFAARLGFAIDPQTMSAMQERAHEIGQVSCERIREELTRMLTEGHARRAFELLDVSGLLREVLPEAAKMHGVEQPPEYHPEGDVWVHTMLLLERLEPGCSPSLAWGALLHDIGKPATFQIDRSAIGTGGKERIRFNGHVEVGLRVAEEILRRLRFSNEDTEQIIALVRNHMRFGDVLEMRESTLKRFLRLPNFDEHLALHWLDCMACHQKLGMWEFTRAAKARYEAEPEAMRPRLLVTGRDLIANGYKPGPRFKQMLEVAEDAQLEGVTTTTEGAMKLVRERFGEAPAP